MEDQQHRAILQELYELRAAVNMHKHLSEMVAADLLFTLQPRDPRHILRNCTHQYSQNYEDSIITEIFSRIGERSKVFVEIGVETGIECNTRALLERGWRGLWIDANAEALRTARNNMKPFLDSGALKIATSLVTADNVQDIIEQELEHLGASIDFLSVDVDYNTSHIWRSIRAGTRVACIEYNAAIAPPAQWEVPYDPAATWDGTNYYGASLKTLEQIGLAKSMSLVGCDFHGVNAFFVDTDECVTTGKFLPPHTAEKHFEPPRYVLVGHRGHPAMAKARSRPAANSGA
jgi:hypothetical protein